MERKTQPLFSAGAIILAAAFGTQAGAEVLVQYDFTNDGGAANPSQTSGSATGSDVTFGGFIGTGGSGGISGTTDVLFARTNATGDTTGDGDSLADAIANENYATFTLTNSTGGDVDLDTLTFNNWFTNPFNTLDARVYVLSDVDGFTDGDELGFSQFLGNGPDVPTDPVDQVLQSFDITSLGTLVNGASIEFRLYITDNSTSNSRIHRIDDVTVNAVPEPGSLALFGLGGLMVARRRRA